MKLATRNLLKSSLLLGLVSVGAYACGQANGVITGTGGSSAGGTGSGGQTGSGGATSAGGTTASGGTTSSGGSHEAGGTVGAGGSNSGGTKATGGSAAGGAATGGSSSGGAGGSGSGGSSVITATGGTAGVLSGGTGGKVTGDGGMVPGTGGKPGDAGVGGKGGTVGPGDGGPAGTGGTSSGSCVKGQVKASEVVFMGESFYAISPQYIETRVESDAQAAGALAAGTKYRNVAVRGQAMNYVLTTEWPAATKGGTVKNVIMDGGGIDAMSSSCSSCPGDFTTLLGKMATEGVTDVIYTRYPEPGSPPGSNATLKGNLDTLMPKMQTVCEGSTAPKCHWVDLRPVWQTGDVLSDGLHPTQSGGNHVGDLLWSEMVKACMAQ